MARTNEPDRVSMKVSTIKGKHKATLLKRIAHLKHTIADIESLPPELGSKWQVGMLRYYKRLLKEAEIRLDGNAPHNSASAT